MVRMDQEIVRFMIDLPDSRSGVLTSLLGQTEFLEDFAHQTKVSESTLEQVKAYEGGKPEPIGADEVGQGQADQNERSCDHVEHFADCH